MSTNTKTDTERFDAFSVRSYAAGGEERSEWTRIGVAFPHKDGKGYSLILQALPVDGKVELRIHEPKKEQAAP